jgi:hypothetical protein
MDSRYLFFFLIRGNFENVRGNVLRGKSPRGKYPFTADSISSYNIGKQAPQKNVTSRWLSAVTLKDSVSAG